LEGLTNRQQALLMLLVFILPSLITWSALGFPTGRAELGILASAILSGILAFVKELLGGRPPPEKEEPHG
jgi:hypothetical protein